MTYFTSNKSSTKSIALPPSLPVSSKTSKKPLSKALKTTNVVEVTSTENLTDSTKALIKHNELIQLMQRPEGISLSELMKLTHWQSHSIRGWISGTLRKKLGLVVTRLKSNAGETSYRIQSVASLS